MPMYKAVIFDLFGTLIENFSVKEHSRVLGEMAGIVGAPVDGFLRLWSGTFLERTTGVFRDSQENIRHVCTALGVHPPDKAVVEASRLRTSFTAHHLRPRPDTVSTLSAIRARGLKTGLISDCSPEVPEQWPLVAFAPLLDVVVLSCEVGMKKPDARIYHLAAQRLRVRPQDCLYVGDGSSRELTGAVRAGMHPVLLSPPSERDNPDVHQIDADDFDGPSVPSLSAVLPLLDALQ